VIPGLLPQASIPTCLVPCSGRRAETFRSRTEQLLLVPKGSRLNRRVRQSVRRYGTADRDVDTIILPDGRSLSLPHLAATDERGQRGCTTR